ncbi:MAG: zinc metallopeptidase [Xanthomonadales bacterium]|nr:zinc metallopeptidase [Xanthomonadales bacterium]
MKWKGRRQSDNVVDSRGRRVANTAGAGVLLNLVGRRFGMKGILVLAIVVGGLWMAGLVDPVTFLGGGTSQTVPYQPSAMEQERFDFVTVVLADTEDVWTAEFGRHGERYIEPQLEIYTGGINTACGMGSAQMGPFYCPGDRKVYIDLSFYDELENTFQAPGDFAQAYVIAHEVGHHVQNLLGTSSKVQAMRGRPDYNEYSVRLELQADYYAGVWARNNQQYLDRGDIEEAIRAANAIGDDAIQGRMQGKVVPHTFTHGTSEQRMRWFNNGLKSGRLEDGDTFSPAYDSL